MRCLLGRHRAALMQDEACALLCLGVLQKRACKICEAGCGIWCGRQPGVPTAGVGATVLRNRRGVMFMPQNVTVG